MKKIFFILFTLVSVPMWSQDIQWSFNILGYSSQKQLNGYAAIQALGRPNALPGGMENVNAWQPKGDMTEEYIKVGFLNPIIAKKIVIIESFHPGYISKVLAYDEKGKEYEIAAYKPGAANTPSRILQIKTGSLNFHVFAIKIVLACEKNIPVAIDAIGISESDKLFKIKPGTNDIIKSNMVAVKLDTNVNSIYPEMGPLISPDGKTLYFSRTNDPADTGGKKDLEDIWYAEWNGNKNNWGMAKNMGAPLNNKDPNYINSVSPDGNTILLGNSYLANGTMKGGVSVSKRTSAGWGIPEKLEIEDNDLNAGDMADYYESNSQKILLISYNRKADSRGDRDLYVSFLNVDTTWTKPLNLGINVNTKGTEAAPLLAADDKTLYFASDGLGGYGGSDIYMSRRLDDSWVNWSEPENLGPVVNTANDESYLTLNAAGNKVYFTSEVNDDVDITYTVKTFTSDAYSRTRH